MTRSKPDILHGPLEKTLVQLSLPVLMGLLGQLVYNITDTLFLAWIDKGSTAIIAGVGLVFPVFFILIALSQGLSTGVSTVVAISIGAGESGEAEKAGATGLVLSCGVAFLAIGLCWMWGDDLLLILAGNEVTPAAISHGKDYLFWLLPGFFLVFFGQTMFGILQGEGLTRYIGPAMILSTAVNVILDPLLIFTFGMGVVGASIATSISYLVLTVFAVVVFIRKGSSLRITPRRDKVSWAMLRRITGLGIPTSLGLIVLSFSFVILNWLMGSVREAALNAFSLAGRFDHLLLTPIFAFSSGMTIIIGQSYGAGDLARVRHAFSHGVFLITGAGITVALLYMAAAPWIFMLFSDAQEVIDLAVRQTRWMAIPTALGAGLGISAGYAFQSLAQPLKSLTAITLRALLLTIPLALALFAFWGVRVESIWIGMIAGNLFGGGIAFFWCRGTMQRLSLKKAEEIIAT